MNNSTRHNMKNDENLKQEFKNKVILITGGTGSLGGWAVAVWFEETASSFGVFDEAEAGNQFVVFNVTVRRVGDGTGNLMGQNMFGSEFRLVTPGGQVLDPSFSSKTPELAPGDMVSGGQVSGYLTYEAPVISGMHYLVFKPDMFNASRLVWGSSVITEPAPTILFSLIVIGATNEEFDPIKTLSLIFVLFFFIPS